ncbi:MAG: hypothetical protein H6780_02640 [Candidatus Nomurabacteria bacterium]|nr:MAG: hypothetical protein H6780_02640 [Candidatus Nomurabacteria bacterium]
MSWDDVDRYSLIGCELAHKKGAQNRCGQISAVNTAATDLFVITVDWDAVTREEFEVVPMENQVFNAGCGCITFYHSALGTVIIRPPACAKTPRLCGREAQSSLF